MVRLHSTTPPDIRPATLLYQINVLIWTSKLHPARVPNYVRPSSDAQGICDCIINNRSTVIQRLIGSLGFDSLDYAGACRFTGRVGIGIPIQYQGLSE
jgi:hypothetical protein